MAVIPPSTKYKYKEWLELMRIEEKKRENAIGLLSTFSRFRTQYLRIHGENDFPNNRFIFCVPELAFPVLHLLAQQWNKSQHVKKFGKLSLYPVPRGYLHVHDSILNFLEMWESGKPSLDTTIFYFEINEDFNLNLKSGDDLDSRVKKDVWNRMQKAKWPSFVNGCCRDYKQAVRVLYEIDFGLLKELNNMHQVVSNLAATLDVAVRALS